MTVSEKIVLREDVARPAAKAAENVERLAGALGSLGRAHVDAGAAAKIERTAKAASKAQDRASEAAQKAASVRESAAKAEEKARAARERAANATGEAEARAAETAKKAASMRAGASAAEEKARELAERAERLRASGIASEKAELLAAQAAGKASRMRAAADRVESAAKKHTASTANAQSKAEERAAKAADEATRKRSAAARAEASAKKLAGAATKAQSAAERAKQRVEQSADKVAERARRRAEREAQRKKRNLDPKLSKTEARLLGQIQKFNPDQERREALLDRQLRDLRQNARRGIDPGEGEGGASAAGLVGGGSRAAAAALAAAAAAVAASAGRAAYEFGAAAVNAAAFREDSMRALEILEKSQKGADRVFKTATATADFIGQGREATVGQFVSLLGKGFDPVLVDRIVRSMADLGTVNPEANVDGIVRAMGKIKAQGYLQGDELSMLSEAGLSVDRIYAKLSQKMGKTTEEIRKMQAAGKLDAATTIEAVLAAINEQSGGRAPGLAARAKSLEDITGLLGRLRALPGNLLMDLEVTPGMRSFKEFIGATLESLDPSGPRWQRIKGVLGKALNSVFGTMFKGRDPGSFIDGLVSKLEGGLPVITSMLSGFNTGFSGALRIFERMDELSGGGPFAQISKLLGINRVPWIELVAKGVGLIAGVIGVVLAGIGVVGAAWAGLVGRVASIGLAFWGGVSAFFEGIHELITGDAFIPEGKAIGDAIVDGIVSAINSGVQAVAAAVRGLATSTIGAGRKAFGIASPSKPFMEIGGFVTKGAEVGITGGAGRVIRAAEAMALGATRAANDNVLGPRAAGLVVSGASSAGGARGAGGGVVEVGRGSGGPVFHIGTVHIEVHGGATERDGEAVARGMWAELRRLAEEVA